MPNDPHDLTPEQLAEAKRRVAKIKQKKAAELARKPVVEADPLAAELESYDRIEGAVEAMLKEEQ